MVEPAPTLFAKHSSGKLYCKTVDAGKTKVNIQIRQMLLKVFFAKLSNLSYTIKLTAKLSRKHLKKSLRGKTIFILYKLSS
jgi:hypothetical protein